MQPRHVLYLIMVGVLLWGAFHAVGAFLLNYNPWRPLMVLACTLVFLCTWALLLRSSAARRSSQR